MSKFLIPIVIALGAFAIAAPRSPATPSVPAPPIKVTWNVEPVGMVEPHPPVEIYYNPLPRGSGRRQWASQMQSTRD